MNYQTVVLINEIQSIQIFRETCTVSKIHCSFLHSAFEYVQECFQNGKRDKMCIEKHNKKQKIK